MNMWRDRRGASAVEFAITAPLFFALLFGIVEAGLILWTQLGLQHATEMAARCASINATTCNSASAIQNFAAQQAFGLSVPASVFTATTPACGNQVAANYTYQFITGYFGLPSLALNAQSCFPK
jgi:Flp pilus assembly protein TadG